MKRSTKRLLVKTSVIVVLIFAIVLAGYFVIQQSIIPAESTFYSGVSYSQDFSNITYTNVISPDFDMVRIDNLFKAWGSGKEFVPFYNNLPFLSFYLKNALNITPTDFTILPGNGDRQPPGCHLQPNYCTPKPVGANIEIYSTSLNADGCTIYNYSTVTRIYHYHPTQAVDCICNMPSYHGYCNFQSSPYNQPGQYDCQQPDFNAGGDWQLGSTDIIIQQSFPNYGGSVSGVKNYRDILQNSGWSWDQSHTCWNSVNVNDIKVNELANKLNCRIYGDSTKCENDGTNCNGDYFYNVQGTVSWEGVSGFDCKINMNDYNNLVGNYKTSRIVTGNVEFSTYKIHIINVVNDTNITIPISNITNNTIMNSTNISVPPQPVVTGQDYLLYSVLGFLAIAFIIFLILLIKRLV